MALVYLIVALASLNTAKSAGELPGAAQPAAIPGVAYLLHLPPISGESSIAFTKDQTMVIGNGEIAFNEPVLFNTSAEVADIKLLQSDLFNATVPYEVLLEEVRIQRSAEPIGLNIDSYLQFTNAVSMLPGYIPYDAGFKMAFALASASCPGQAAEFRTAATQHLERFQLPSSPTSDILYNTTDNGGLQPQLYSSDAPFNASLQLNVRVQWLSPQLSPFVSCGLYAVTMVGTWQQLPAPCVGAVHGHPLPGDEGTHWNGSWAPGLAWRANHTARLRVHLPGYALGRVPGIQQAMVLNCSQQHALVGVSSESVTPSQLQPWTLVDVPKPIALSNAAQLHGVALHDTNSLAPSTNFCAWELSTSSAHSYCGAHSVAGSESSRIALDAQALWAGATSILAGNIFMCVLRMGGAVECLGENAALAIGQGDGGPQGPVQLGQPAISIAVGAAHVCAVLLDYSVACWGVSRSGGTLGLGYETDDTVVAVTPGSNEALPASRQPPTMATGNDFSCVLQNHSCIKCWGAGGDGQLRSRLPGSVLGDTPETVPQKLPCIHLPEEHSFVGVAAGVLSTCALTAGGAVLCWGAYEFGSAPRQLLVVQLPSAAYALQLSSSNSLMCAGLVLGTWQCWGTPDRVASALNVPMAAPIAQGVLAAYLPALNGADMQHLVLNTNSFCGWTTAGVHCWGQEAAALLGLPSSDSIGMHEVTKGLTVGPPHTQAFIHGSSHALQAGRIGEIRLDSGRGCSLAFPSGRVSCWGLWSNPLPWGAEAAETVPAINGNTLRLLGPAVSIAMSKNGGMAILRDGGVQMWGKNNGDEQGYGVVRLYHPPGRKLQLQPGIVTCLAPADDHVCIAFQHGQVQCWGDGNAGKLGYGNEASIGDFGPLTTKMGAYVSLSTAAMQVVTGKLHSCALLVTGQSQCWGAGSALGFGDDGSLIGNTPGTLPSLVGPSSLFPLSTMLRGDQSKTCGLTPAGGIWCSIDEASGHDAVLLEGAVTFNVRDRSVGILLCWLSESGSARCSALAINGAANAAQSAAQLLPFASSVQRIALAQPSLSDDEVPVAVCAVLLSGATQCVEVTGGPSGGLSIGVPAGIDAAPQEATQHVARMPSRYLILPQPDGLSLQTVSVLATPAQLRGGAVGGISSMSPAAIQQVRLLPLWLQELQKSSHVERPQLLADLLVPCIQFGATLAPTNPLQQQSSTLQSARRVDVVAGTTTVADYCGWPQAAFEPQGRILAQGLQLAGSPAGSAVLLSPLGGQSLQLSGSFWLLLLLHQGPVNITVGDMQCDGALTLRPSVYELNCLTRPLQAGTVIPAGGGLPVLLHHTFPLQASPVAFPDNITFAAPSILSAAPAVGNLSLAVGGGRRLVGGSQEALGVRGGTIALLGSNLAPTAVLSIEQGITALIAITVHNAAAGGSQVGVCSVLAASFGQVLCSMPPLTGRVYLSATIAGGVASTTRTPFIYASPSISTVLPAVLYHNSAAQGNASLDIRGNNLGHTAAAISGVTVAGLPCIVLWVSPEHVQCAGIPIRALPANSAQLGAGVVVSFAAGQSPVAVGIEVVGQPTITTVQIVNGTSGTQGSGFLAQHGGVVRILGSSFAPSAAASAAAAAVSITISGRPCAVSVVLPSSILCALGPGIGSLADIILTRFDGAVASLANAPLQYEVPVIFAIAPSILLPLSSPAPAGAPSTANMTITGSLFGQSAQPVAISLIKLEGALQIVLPCAAAAWLSSTELHCQGLPLAQLRANERFGGSTISVVVGGAAASILSSATVELLPAPEVSSVQPAAVGAGGGVRVQLYGAGLGTSASDIASIHIGDSPCSSFQWLSSTRLWCTAPSLAAAGSASAAIVVRTIGGLQSDPAGAALAYRQPQIFSVNAEQRLLSVATAATSLATLNVTGTELGVPGQEADAGMSIGGVDCVAAGGRILLPSPTGSEMVCAGFRQSALPLPSGFTEAVPVILRTPSGTSVSQAAGAIILQAPVLSRVDPSSAAAGSPVVLLGEAFGWRAADVQSVAVGPQALNRTAWQWSQSSITITSLPAPVAGSVRALTVQVTLTSGYVAQLPDAFSYLAAAQAPVLSPIQPCTFRDQLGTAQAVFVWEGSPAAAWAVRTSGPLPPWTTPAAAAAPAPATSLVDAGAGQAMQDFNASVRLPVYCPHTWSYLLAHPTAKWHQVPVLAAQQGQVQWLQVAATESRTDRALDGPMSVHAGPLLPACSSSAGDEQYLSTQFAPSGQWAQVLCRPCPAGAVCGGRPFEAIVNAAGTFRADWDRSGLTFVPCPRPQSCVQRSPPLISAAGLPYLQSSDPNIPIFVSTLQPNDIIDRLGSGQLSTADAAAPSDSAAVCPVGYTGRLCAQCATSFTRAGNRECSPCASTGLVWFALVSGVAVGIAGMAFLTVTTLRSKGEPNKAHVALAKMMFSHMQMIGIASAFPFEWPDPLRGLFSVLDAGSSVGTALVSVDCLGFDSSAFRASSATQLLLPLIALCVVSAMWALREAVWPHKPADASQADSPAMPTLPAFDTQMRRNPLRKSIGIAAGTKISKQATPAATRASLAPRRTFGKFGRCDLDVSSWTGWVVSVIVVSFVLHLSLVKTSLSVMTCDEVAGKRFLVGDYDVECSDPANAGWIYGLGMSGLLLYGAGIPLGSFLVMWRRRDRLQDASIRSKLGFLYVTYTADAWYWEMIVLLRKVGLAVIAVLLAPLGAGLQSTCAIVLLGSSMLVHERMTPFRDALLNKLESSSLFVALITIAGGAALLDDTVGIASKQFVTVMLLLSNAVFLFIVVFLLVRGVALHEDNRKVLGRLLSKTGLRPASVRLLLGKAAAASASHSNDSSATTSGSNRPSISARV